MKKFIIVSLVILSCANLFAEVFNTHPERLDGVIVPKPRNINGQYEEILLSEDHITIDLIGVAKEAVAGTSAKGILKLSLNQAFDKIGANAIIPEDKITHIQIIGALISDPRIKEELKTVPEIPPQGYVIVKTLSNEKGIRIVVAGADRKGLFYGFSTLRQMLLIKDNFLYLNYINVFDYPTWQGRFASDDIDPGNMQRYLDLAINKVSGFAWQYRTDWRVFGTTEGHKRVLSAMKNIGGSDVIDFMLLLHVYTTNREEKFFNIADDNDVNALIEKVRLAAENHIETVMICVDDHTLRENDSYIFYNEEEAKVFDNSIGKAHGYLMKRIYEALKPEFPHLRLAMVGAPYSLNHGIGKPDIDKYVIDWGKMAPKDVFWVWTGPEVISPEIAKEDYLRFKNLLSGQPMFVWDNSNCIGEPMPVWETKLYDDLAKDSKGIIYWNNRTFFYKWPWSYPYILTANAYTWNASNYNADEVFKTVVGQLYGKQSVEVVWDLRNSMIACQEAIASGDRSNFAQLLANFEKAYVDASKTIDNLGKPLPVSSVDGWLKISREFHNIAPSNMIAPAKQNPIKVDGIIEAQEWDNSGEFELTMRDVSEDNQPVKGKVFYAPEGLYLAFDVPNTSELKKLDKQRHDSPTYLHDDNISIFLQPSVSGAYVHFCFDYEGNRFEEKEATGGFNWNGYWNVGVKRNEQGWQAEVFIPIIELELVQPTQPESGKMWKLNIHRSSKFRNGVQSFSHGGVSFHNTQFFGELLMK